MTVAAIQKGLPFAGAGGRADRESAGLTLFHDLPLPAAVVLDSALRHNLEWMQSFVDERGALFAPHAKTTMSPQLIRLQIEQGAWAVTVASAHQAAICVQHGFRRIIIANQVIGAPAQDALFGWLADYPDLEVYALVDSSAAVRQLGAAAARAKAGPPLNLLVELGYAGGRTGCRSVAEAVEVARLARETAGLRLAGVEGFEGLQILDAGDESGLSAIQAFLASLADLFARCRSERLFEVEAPIITAGGSAYYDIVIPALAGAGGRVVTRSGCYVTHDHGIYQRNQRHVLDRTKRAAGLRPALEVWGYVQSLPEPGRAILTVGKRDVGYDAGLPVPLKHWSATHDRVAELGGGYAITGLNDQHAYLSLPEEHGLEVGDAIGLGVSHPCTTFDKWRVLSLVDDDYAVLAALETFF